MMQIPIVWENWGDGRGDDTICTPFFLQTTFAFTQASFTVTPAPSITPPNRNFGRRLDFAWTLFCINFCSYERLRNTLSFKNDCKIGQSSAEFETQAIDSLNYSLLIPIWNGYGWAQTFLL